jgi:hypothetical protein
VYVIEKLLSVVDLLLDTRVVIPAVESLQLPGEFRDPFVYLAH